MNIQKYPLIFVFMTFCISRIMNAKKKLEIREGSQEQWKHTSTPQIFFSFHQFFPMNTQKDSLPFFYAFSVFLEVMNAKKSPNERYFLGFSWKFPDFGHYFRETPNFREHQILACTKLLRVFLHQIIATPLPNAIIWNAR